MTSACLVGSAPLVSLDAPKASEVKEREEAKHRHREPMMAANDSFIVRTDR